MGEVNSCIKEDHIYLKQYVKATNKKRSLAFVTSSGQPLNTKVLFSQLTYLIRQSKEWLRIYSRKISREDF
jgi:hypothetical protein